jgi:hypothetical protein
VKLNERLASERKKKMTEYIKSQGWKVVGKTKSEYFTGRNSAVNCSVVLEVIPGKVLINGNMFHSYIVPTVKEAQDFLSEI